MSVFTRGTNLYTTMRPIEWGDGTWVMQVQAHGVLTAKQPYKIIYNQHGCITAALADDEYYFYVGVPFAAVASEAIDWIQVGGVCPSMIVAALTMTAGDAVKMYDGAVVDTTAAFTGAVGEFGICYTSTTGADDVLDVILIPERIRQASS